LLLRRAAQRHACRHPFSTCLHPLLLQVLEVIAGHRGIEDREQLAQQVFDISSHMFFPQL
jgi:hypothetical protein